MRTTFDTSQERAGRLDTSGIDWDAFGDQPLAPDALRCLRYMHDVEHHTVCYLRDLLLTPAHRDPAITAFLSCWVFEELWHGEAIARVLAAHGEPAGPARIAPLRRQRRVRDTLGLLAHFGASTVSGDSFVAVHMSWGAVNEWTTQAGYARLGARAGHPVLSDLLRRIMKQEGRHIDFYASEAARRLGGDRRARRLTRFALAHLWHPVGAGVMPVRLPVLRRRRARHRGAHRPQRRPAARARRSPPAHPRRRRARVRAAPRPAGTLIRDSPRAVEDPEPPTRRSR
jgi:hypothetical protein